MQEELGRPAGMEPQYGRLLDGSRSVQQAR
jgi:hypothetical protein